MSGDVELRRAAEAATPGPWECEETERGREVCGPRTRIPGGWESAVLTDSAGPTDAAFIAAANPATVLALLDRVEAAEGALLRVEALAETYWTMTLADKAVGGEWLYHRLRAALGGGSGQQGDEGRAS